MPAKKKGKKKGDILARMTIDQRRQYLERKAAQELEKNRRREELLAGFLKLKLEDEQRKAALNEAKLSVKWRTVLREAKKESLVTQLKNSKEWIEEITKNQDQLIQILITTLQKAHHQRTAMSERHLSFIHKMAELHEEHIAMLTKNFRENELHLIKSTAQNIQMVTEEHIHQLKKIDFIAQAAEEQTEETEAKETILFKDAVASIKVKLEEEAMTALEEEQRELEDAWTKLLEFLLQFEEQTVEYRDKCQDLQKKVESNLAIKDKIDAQAKQMQKEINTYKNQISGYQTSYQTDLLQSQSSQRLLMNSIILQRNRFKEKIKVSNRVADSVFEKLSELITCGEEILQLADLCRRMETTRDKNLPYRPKPSLTDAYAALQNKEAVSQKPVGIYLEPTLEPTQSDSGVGTSIKTEPSLTVVTEEKKRHQEISSGDSYKDVLLKELPKHTSERIQVLLRDEMLLKEVASPSRRKVLYPESDYVAKEAESVLQIHEHLSNFWTKLNGVEVQTLSLKKEAKDISRENKELKNTLRNFLFSKGISNRTSKLKDSPLSTGVLPLLPDKRKILA